MALDDVRVLIIGDSPLARAGLAALLANQPGLDVVGQSAADPNFDAILTVYRPDALAWDLGWDAQHALELFADVKDIVPPTLMLLADESRAADAINSGARGVLLQDADANLLTAALSS